MSHIEEVLEAFCLLREKIQALGSIKEEEVAKFINECSKRIDEFQDFHLSQETPFEDFVIKALFLLNQIIDFLEGSEVLCVIGTLEPLHPLIKYLRNGKLICGSNPYTIDFQKNIKNFVAVPFQIIKVMLWVRFDFEVKDIRKRIENLENQLDKLKYRKDGF